MMRLWGGIGIVLCLFFHPGWGSGRGVPGGCETGVCQSRFDTDDGLDSFDGDAWEEFQQDASFQSDEPDATDGNRYEKGRGQKKIDIDPHESEYGGKGRQKPLNDQKKGNAFLSTLLEDSVFTLGYQLSHGVDENASLITNRSFIRHQFERLIAGRLFFKFDGKLSFLLPSDHGVDADDANGTGNSHWKRRGRFRECYLQGGTDLFSLKVGKQIGVWGKADTVAVTDILSPRDRSEFIFIDLEDSRFGQWMISADLYLEVLDLFLFVSPCPAVDDAPDRGTRYYRGMSDEFFISGVNTVPDTDSILQDQLFGSPYPLQFQDDRPEWGDVEYGIKLDKSYEKTEVSLMAGRFFSNSALFEFDGRGGESRQGKKAQGSRYRYGDDNRDDGCFVDLSDGAEKKGPIMMERYPQYTMIGGAISHALDSVLLKAEVAYKHRLPLQGTGTNENSGDPYFIDRAAVWDMAVGVDFNANDRYHLTVEISNRHIGDFNEEMTLVRRNSSSCYTTFTKACFNEILELEYDFYYHFQDRNRFHQFHVAYDLTDTLKIKTSLALFHMENESSALGAYGGEDRFTLEILKFF